VTLSPPLYCTEKAPPSYRVRDSEEALSVKGSLERTMWEKIPLWNNNAESARYMGTFDGAFGAVYLTQRPPLEVASVLLLYSQENQFR
jgi:hypothetical protein